MAVSCPAMTTEDRSGRRSLFLDLLRDLVGLLIELLLLRRGEVATAIGLDHGVLFAVDRVILGVELLALVLAHGAGFDLLMDLAALLMEPRINFGAARMRRRPLRRRRHRCLLLRLRLGLVVRLGCRGSGDGEAAERAVRAVRAHRRTPIWQDGHPPLALGVWRAGPLYPLPRPPRRRETLGICGAFSRSRRLVPGMSCW